jgi:squalene synthase HpnC
MSGANLDLPAPAAVMARARGENFPVASRVLPRPIRERLLAIYGFARLADELGDSADRSPAERLAALDWLADELAGVYDGRARHPLLVRLQEVLDDFPRLPREPFERLIEANRMDQRVTHYETWEQLLGYCHLSADPVGELVLWTLAKAGVNQVALAERICTALQLAEHWQDVAEDLARGRIYVPARDMERFGVTERDLREPSAGPRLRDLMAFEVARTRTLLEEGEPLLGAIRGRRGWRDRVAVAAFASGGRAALEAIERAGYDVLGDPPALKATRAWRTVALARTLAGRR